MKILKKTPNIDFIAKIKPAVFISSVINLAILVGIALFGFNWGVDFAGGTVVELKFKQPITAQEVRERAEREVNGHRPLEGVSVQQIGSASENSYLLRMGGVTQLTPERAVLAEESLKKLGTVQSFRPDLNNGIINLRTAAKVDEQQVRQAVQEAGTGLSEVRFLGEAQGGGFDYQLVASGMADQVFSVVKGDLPEPDFIVQRVDYVGPQIGKQLRNKGIAALFYSFLAILVYVAFRFEFKFAPGALLALLHDCVMVSGYYLVTRAEFNLTSIAVLLTIVGYSINDTIVIYDRIREEMARYKGKPLAEIINISVNEMLARTLLTAGVTALSLIGLLIFGVGEIFDFAAAMMVGIIVGCYSSIYIASPLTLALDKREARLARRKGGAAQGRPSQAGAA